MPQDPALLTTGNQIARTQLSGPLVATSSQRLSPTARHWGTRHWGTRMADTALHFIELIGQVR